MHATVPCHICGCLSVALHRANRHLGPRDSLTACLLSSAVSCTSCWAIVSLHATGPCHAWRCLSPLMLQAHACGPCHRQMPPTHSLPAVPCRFLHILLGQRQSARHSALPHLASPVTTDVAGLPLGPSAVAVPLTSAYLLSSAGSCTSFWACASRPPLSSAPCGSPAFSSAPSHSTSATLHTARGISLLVSYTDGHLPVLPSRDCLQVVSRQGDTY